MSLTPDKREAMKARMGELKARMDEMRPVLNSTTIPQWVELYQEREAVEEQLGDDVA